MNKLQTEKLQRILSKVGDVSFRRRVLKVLEYLDMQEGDRLLDCGCGEGFYTMVIRELFGEKCTIVSFDRDLPLMQKARAWLDSRWSSRFVMGDAGLLPYKDGVFDKIIFSEVLEHVPDDVRVIDELKRVLKHHGTIALTVPNHHYPLLWDPLNWMREACGLGHFNPDNGLLGGLWAMHLRLYTLEGLEQLVRRGGFSIQKKDMITHYCLPFNHLILYVGKRIGNVVPIPQSVAKAMEKFEWKNSNPTIVSHLIDLIMKVVNFVDRKNDGVEQDTHKSSVCIALKLTA